MISRKTLSLAILVFLVFIVAISPFQVFAQGSNNRGDQLRNTVVIYGSVNCPYCRALHVFLLDNKYNVIFRDVGEYNNREDFFNLVTILNLEPSVPLSIVFNKEGYITAIVVGAVLEKDFWNTLLNKEFKCRIEVYLGEYKGIIKNIDIISKIHKIVLHTDKIVLPSYCSSTTSVTTTTSSINSSVSSTGNPGSLLVQMFVLASIDSINPCAISTTVLLAIMAVSMGFTGSRKYIPVIAFIIGVYLGYVIAGYIISIVITLSRLFMYIILFLALGIIVKDAIDLYRGENVNIECKRQECVPKVITRLPKPILPLGILVFGIVVSWTFMMCSAAPYIFFLTYIAKVVEEISTRTMYVLAYCAIVVIPLVIAGVAPFAFIKRIGLTLKKILIVRIIVFAIIASILLYYILFF